VRAARVTERAVERDANRAIGTSYTLWRVGSCEEAELSAAGRCVHYLPPDYVTVHKSQGVGELFVVVEKNSMALLRSFFLIATLLRSFINQTQKIHC
jgi:hypothetical protein